MYTIYLNKISFILILISSVVILSYEKYSCYKNKYMFRKAYFEIDQSRPVEQPVATKSG